MKGRHIFDCMRVGRAVVAAIIYYLLSLLSCAEKQSGRREEVGWGVAVNTRREYELTASTPIR
jgi:hypothetical protein